MTCPLLSHLSSQFSRNHNPKRKWTKEEFCSHRTSNQWISNDRKWWSKSWWTSTITLPRWSGKWIAKMTHSCLLIYLICLIVLISWRDQNRRGLIWWPTSMLTRSFRDRKSWKRISLSVRRFCHRPILMVGQWPRETAKDQSSTESFQTTWVTSISDQWPRTCSTSTTLSKETLFLSTTTYLWPREFW